MSPLFISGSEVDSQTTVKSFILTNKQIHYSAVTHTHTRTHTDTHRGTTDSKTSTRLKWETKKRILVWSRKGSLFTGCQGVGTQAQISCRETLSLWHSLQDPVWPGPVKFDHRGTLCSERLLSPTGTKWELVGETQRGESLLSSHLLSSLRPLFSSPSAPQTNCRAAGVQAWPRVGHYTPTMTLLSSTFRVP